MTKALTRITVAGAVLLAAFAKVQADEAPPEGEKKKSYEFKVEKIKPQPIMSIRFRVADPTTLGAKYAEAFGKLVPHIAANGGQVVGMPFGRYHSASDKGLDIEAGIPVAKKIAEAGDIKAGELPGGRVITTVHVGPYEQLSKAHTALEKWVTDKGYVKSGGVWEYYVTDPGQEPDPSKWQTKLFQPIADKGSKSP